MLATNTDICKYLNIIDSTSIDLITQSLQKLYQHNLISYPRTLDKNINNNDLESLERLLNIRKTTIQSSNNHYSIFGPIRPIAFPVDSNNISVFSKLDLFLHELITDNSIVWLSNIELSNLRDQDQDIEYFTNLIS